MPAASPSDKQRQTEALLSELEAGVGTAMGGQLGAWAKQIVDQELDLKAFLPLLYAEKPTSTRFSWMLTCVGQHKPEVLLAELPGLFAVRHQVNVKDFDKKFSKYWHVVGIPPENEGEAVNLLFDWLMGQEVNISTRSYCAYVLFKMTKKFPDLQQELKAIFLDQRGKYSNAYEKQIGRLLADM